MRVLRPLAAASLLFALVLPGPALAQDPEPQPAPEPELTPEQMVEMMREIQELMGRAEELLQRAADNRDPEQAREMQERIAELLRQMENSRDSQSQAIERMSELIRRAPQRQGEGQGEGQGPGQPQSQQQREGDPQGGQAQRNPGDPATRPYDPSDTDPINRFRSDADRHGRWGELPPRARQAIMHDLRSLDEFPPEYRQLLMEYLRRLNEEESP